MSRCVLLLTGLLLPAPVALAEEKVDEKAIRAVVEDYFATYATKDIDKVMALWSARSPDAAVWRERFKMLFAQTRALKLDKLTLTRIETAGTEVRVRFVVTMAGNGLDGKPHPSLG